MLCPTLQGAPGFGDDRRTGGRGARACTWLRARSVLPATSGWARCLRRFAGQVDPRRPPDPQFVRHLLDHRSVAVVHLADREEVGVRGDLERVDEVGRAVVGTAGVAEFHGRDVDARPGAETGVGVEDARFEAADRGDRLERRAGRVGAFGRAVDQRSRFGLARSWRPARPARFRPVPVRRAAW